MTLSGLTLVQPWWLLMLLAVAAAAVAAAALHARRQASVLRFTGVTLLSDLVDAPRRSRLPALLAAAGVLLLTVGLAEPRLPALFDTQRANVVLLVDTSGSMSAVDVAPSRLAAAQKAATAFVDALPEQWKAALVAFSEKPVVVTPPTSDRAAVIAGLNGLAAANGTATGDALDMAINVGRAGSPARLADALTLGDALENPSRAVVVLLSDGKPTSGVQTVDAVGFRAKRLGVPVFAIAFGTDAGAISVLDPATGNDTTLPVPPDPATMERLAAMTGGQAFTAVTAEELTAVYQSVSAQLEEEAGTIDLSVGFKLAGVALLVAAGLLAVSRRVGP